MLNGLYFFRSRNHSRSSSFSCFPRHFIFFEFSLHAETSIFDDLCLGFRLSITDFMIFKQRSSYFILDLDFFNFRNKINVSFDSMNIFFFKYFLFFRFFLFFSFLINIWFIFCTYLPRKKYFIVDFEFFRCSETKISVFIDDLFFLEIYYVFVFYISFLDLTIMFIVNLYQSTEEKLFHLWFRFVFGLSKRNHCII